MHCSTSIDLNTPYYLPRPGMSWNILVAADSEVLKRSDFELEVH